MRVMMIAGEASGDVYGAGVIRELKRRDPSCEVFGVGGDRMQSAGAELVYHVRELAVMGFWEVLRHLPLLRSVNRTLTALLIAKKPEVIVLIDYPGFNLRFAAVAKAQGVKVVYYISPQVWAWNPGRVRKMRGIVDTMLVVLPFEEEIYRNKGIDVKFVGHPLLEVLEEPIDRAGFCTRYGFDPNGKILGLFPGSRKQELERIFPAMLGAARTLHRKTGVQVAIGVAPVLDLDYVRSFLRDDFPVSLLVHATHDLMKNSDVAIVTSGTATLEVGYYRTPMVIVYRTSMLSYLIGRMVVRIKNIGLVNIVAGEQIVPELIQDAVKPDRIVSETLRLLTGDKLREEISGRLAVVRERLGTPGASSRVADVVCSYAGIG
jgi:lipid-A-disaccharide synthase